MNDPKKIISSADAINLILQGKELAGYSIKGATDLYNIAAEIKSKLIIRECFVENLVSPSVEFIHELSLIGSHFEKCSFNYAYFIGGLTIDNCIFESYLDFEAGGHNQKNCPFRIKQSSFLGFVNFFDCWFQSKVEVVDNDFKKGTNLLGNKGKPFRVQ